ncbi:hypothetical protein GLOIN_2v1772305 [Rhizophagus irregularis DAOM 181602=DAOM 197198]|uniref:Uncharacterized protein n=1 Tax=Rhizophagus irregularis (strain DAOM 181602 / DAOM 197198 / MUCL 43194) TaxID=747089 RepID=A0A2P4Q7M8_RHIID|nr:hypothetical protein GLOIN_2v1772305 [Rhizophagus irregularis DAOM 181602=DAOM 197198]POG73646.1 hypothetical protein GLOIN_2v1772305 [Rhizophagus irregularis DAOM 181602=DAOM 197198]|eukprot:XP_025180512.1 hypothetical protein GLOIN_2v1772305 [Rhizophagus irregularis DAOM 181602=DAOM 197198]
MDILSSSSGYTLECRDPKEHKSAKSHSLNTSKSSAKKLYVGRYEEDSLISITYTAATDTIANWIKSATEIAFTSNKVFEFVCRRIPQITLLVFYAISQWKVVVLRYLRLYFDENNGGNYNYDDVDNNNDNDNYDGDNNDDGDDSDDDDNDN